MASEAHLRIDEGIKRGPRKQVDRRPKQALNGRIVSKVTPEQRQIVLADAYQAIMTGETTDDVAARHNIPARTIRHWLLDDPNADEARKTLINGELARTLDEMKDAKFASSPLPLACAREEFRAWSWIAERRESRLYGQSNKITVTNEPLSKVDQELLGSAQELLRLFKSRVKALPDGNK